MRKIIVNNKKLDIMSLIHYNIIHTIGMIERD